MALLERLGLLPGMDAEWDDAQEEGSDGIDQLSHNEYMLDSLARSVGGMRVLETLTTDALPVEPLDRTGIPGNVITRVADVAELVDGCCDDLFDEEFRTACRGLLARVAVADSYGTQNAVNCADSIPPTRSTSAIVT